MNGQQDAIFQMAYLGIGLGVVGVFVLTGIVPVVQVAQTIVSAVLQALGV